MHMLRLLSGGSKGGEGVGRRDHEVTNTVYSFSLECYFFCLIALLEDIRATLNSRI